LFSVSVTDLVTVFYIDLFEIVNELFEFSTC